LKTRPFRSRRSLDYRKGTTQGISRLFEMPKRREQRARLLRQQETKWFDGSKQTTRRCDVPRATLLNMKWNHESPFESWVLLTFPDFQTDFFDPIDIMASPYHRQSPEKSVCQCNCRLEFKAPHYCNVNRLWHMWYSSERWGVWRVLRKQDPPRVLSLSTSPHPALHINDKRRRATFEVAKLLCCFVFLSSALLKLFNICWILFCRVNCKAN
jgi:hypothetical protein